jgi:hypothetical protein
MHHDLTNVLAAIAVTAGAVYHLAVLAALAALLA